MDQVILNRDDQTRKIGFGKNYLGNGVGMGEAAKRFVGDVQAAMKMPTYNLPVIESVRVHYPGPLTDAQIQGSFGATINPLGANQASPPPGATSVESTFAEPGKFQTYVLILAIGFQLEPDPMALTIKGNSWTAPATGQLQPVSPDAFNSTVDGNFTAGVSGGAAAPLGLASGQTLLPADLEWGWWAERAFFHMSRAYNLVWQFGNRTLITRDSLRYTAHTPSSAQEGSSSSSEVDIQALVRATNGYYTSSSGLNSPQIFLPIDRVRVGNMTLATSGAGSSVFRPSRAYETAGVTFGAMGLRSILGKNAEFRRLSYPLLFKPGVPIGLRADVSDTTEQAAMQAWFSATQGLGGAIPANFTAASNVNVGSGVTGTATIGAEPSLDNPVAPQGQTTFANRVIYKGGTFKITVCLKGLELTDDQAAMLGDQGVRSMLQSSCGCAMASG
jgi:hypothetical protein